MRRFRHSGHPVGRRRWPASMRTLGVLLFALASASAAFAQADLQVTSAAVPASGLWLGDEVLVSTTVRNNGPGSVPESDVGFSASVEEGYYFHFVRSESPECDYDALDINPPRFNYRWTFPPLAAGESHTCVIRLVVFDVPATGRVRHSGRVYSDVTDPYPDNNALTLDFSFGTVTPASARAIPAGSALALVLIAILLLGTGILPSADSSQPRTRASLLQQLDFSPVALPFPVAAAPGIGVPETGVHEGDQRSYAAEAFEVDVGQERRARGVHRAQ